MATQICPNCKADAFTWSIDEESGLTMWGCHECGYIAWEDETLERVCSNCGGKSEMNLKDGTKEFWWCCSCNRVTVVAWRMRTTAVLCKCGATNKFFSNRYSYHLQFGQTERRWAIQQNLYISFLFGCSSGLDVQWMPRRTQSRQRWQQLHRNC